MTHDELDELNDYQLRQVADGCFITAPEVIVMAYDLLCKRDELAQVLTLAGHLGIAIAAIMRMYHEQEVTGEA